MKLSPLFAFTLAAAALAPTAFAQTKTFTVVGDRLQMRNLATVESVTDFETFVGKTTNVTGSIQFDPAKRTGGGTIVVDVKSVDTGVPLRNEHMLSSQWLNADKNPRITFTARQVRFVQGDQYRVTGTLNMNGRTRPVTANVRVRYRAASEATKEAGFTGDVILVSTSFPVKLSDFGVNIAQGRGKVADQVTLTLNAYATSSK